MSLFDPPFADKSSWHYAVMKRLDQQCCRGNSQQCPVLWNEMAIWGVDILLSDLHSSQPECSTYLCREQTKLKSVIEMLLLKFHLAHEKLIASATVTLKFIEQASVLCIRLDLLLIAFLWERCKMLGYLWFMEYKYGM